MDRLSNIAWLPYYEAKPLLDRLNNDLDNLSATNVVSRKIIPRGVDSLIDRAYRDAYLGLMQVGLAVELYYNQNSICPETIDDIAPILDGEIPLDPFTGKDFVYEVHENGFSPLLSDRNGQ